MHTHTHTCHTHTYTYTHAHTHTCHTHTYAYTHAHTHIHTCTHTHTHMHTHAHTYTHVHTHTYTHIHTHMPHSHRVFFLRFNDDLPRCLKCLKCLYPSPPKPNEVYYELIYKGGWLLTSPHDEVEEISQNVPTTPEPEREETDPSARLLHNPVHEVHILGDDRTLCHFSPSNHPQEVQTVHGGS